MRRNRRQKIDGTSGLAPRRNFQIRHSISRNEKTKTWVCNKKIFENFRNETNFIYLFIFRLILDSENWKQAEVPQRFQQMIDRIQETGELRKSPRNAAIEQTSAYLTLNGHQYALVGFNFYFLFCF